MSFWLTVVAVVASSLLALFFSALTYSLRDYSRAKLADLLNRRGKGDYAPVTNDNASDLTFVTAIGRLFANILVLVGVLALLERTDLPGGMKYLLAVVITGLILIFCSVAIPHAISRHAAEDMIATFIRFLHGLRLLLTPFTKL